MRNVGTSLYGLYFRTWDNDNGYAAMQKKCNSYVQRLQIQ